MLSIQDRQRLDEAFAKAREHDGVLARLDEGLAKLRAELEEAVQKIHDRFDMSVLREKRPPIKIPPFPKSLRELGFRPPKHEEAHK